MLLRHPLGISDVYLDYSRRSWTLRAGQQFIPQHGNVTCVSESVADQIRVGRSISRLSKFALLMAQIQVWAHLDGHSKKNKGGFMNATLVLVRPARTCD